MSYRKPQPRHLGQVVTCRGIVSLPVAPLADALANATFKHLRRNRRKK